MAAKSDDSVSRLVDIMARLRHPDTGCPWDLEQSFVTIAPYTIEEAYEVADAIERGALGELRDELGDLLFQVVFHARMAEEEGAFDFQGVVSAICEKMIRRHPHVFDRAAGGPFAGEPGGRLDAAQQSRNWEAIKAAERAASASDSPTSELDGVPAGLPALARSEKLQRRAARVGFDWPSLPPVLAKVREELEEIEAAVREGAAQDTLDEEIGDLLFSVVNAARHCDVGADGALRRANLKFERRFRSMEAEAGASGHSLGTLDEAQLDRLWNAVKAGESGGD